MKLPRDAVYPAKHYLRAKAKSLDLYKLPVTIGHDEGGDPFEASSVGCWLFGTPGYIGHLRVTELDGRLVQLEWPSDSPAQVHDLIRQLVDELEA